MSKLYNTLYSCLQRAPAVPDQGQLAVTDGGQPVAEPVPGQEEEEIDDTKANGVKENDAPELRSDKKTDEIIEPEKQAGYLWRIGSGVYGLTTGAVGGAVGVGVGSVKWVAGKGYDAGHAVVSTGAAIVTKVKVKRKSKNE